MTIEGTPLSTSAVKRMAFASLVAASELRKIDAGANSNGNPDKARQTQQNPRPDDRVGHASADLAHGLGILRKKRKIERTRALVKQVGEDGDQRRNHQRRRQDRQPRHQVVRRAANRDAHCAPCLLRVH